MGLVGENCSECKEVAEDPEGGGLAGSWWRFWASVSIDDMWSNVDADHYRRMIILGI